MNWQKNHQPRSNMMKRNILTLIALLPLAGCGGMAGTYSCENVGFVRTIELTSHGMVFAEADIYGTTQKTAGTYKLDGDRLITDVGGRSNVFDVVDRKLVLGNGQCTRK
jgi:hypothetical protein